MSIILQAGGRRSARANRFGIEIGTGTQTGVFVMIGIASIRIGETGTEIVIVTVIVTVEGRMTTINHAGEIIMNEMRTTNIGVMISTPDLGMKMNIVLGIVIGTGETGTEIGIGTGTETGTETETETEETETEETETEAIETETEIDHCLVNVNPHRRLMLQDPSSKKYLLLTLIAKMIYVQRQRLDHSNFIPSLVPAFLLFCILTDLSLLSFSFRTCILNIMLEVC